MLCAVQNIKLIELYRGDALVVEVTVDWEDGTLADLTAFNARFSAANSITKDSHVPSEVEIVSPPTSGIFKVFLFPEDTESLNKNYDYEYKAQIYDASNNVYTVLAGTFRVI